MLSVAQEAEAAAVAEEAEAAALPEPPQERMGATEATAIAAEREQQARAAELP